MSTIPHRAADRSVERPDVSDPYGDDGSSADDGGPETDSARVDDLLPALWAMLARTETGAASTLPALRLTLAERLADALRRRGALHLDLARALADMLALGARDASRFPEAAREACREALERLMLAFDADPPGLASQAAAHDGLAPLAVVAMASGGAARRVRVLLDPLGVGVIACATAEDALEILAETPAELVVTERGVFDASFARLRRQPMHLRTPVLAFGGPELDGVTRAAMGRGSPGVRWVPRPRSRAEFVLQVRLSLPDA